MIHLEARADQRLHYPAQAHTADTVLRPIVPQARSWRRCTQQGTREVGRRPDSDATGDDASVTGTMYLAGDLSGIQRFVLRVKSAGKAQAKRLRARSFFLELVERAALWHVEQRLHTSDDDVLIRGGGGFLVRLQSNADRAHLERLETDLQHMLWDEFGGELQFALGWATTPADARVALERRKRQPGRSVLQSRRSWDVERFTRPSLAEPCQVCGEFPGFQDVHDDEEDRVVDTAEAASMRARSARISRVVSGCVRARVLYAHSAFHSTLTRTIGGKP